MHTNPIVTVWQAGKDPYKAVRIDRLQVPLHICLGRLEAATDDELETLLGDVTHELARRSA